MSDHCSNENNVDTSLLVAFFLQCKILREILRNGANKLGNHWLKTFFWVQQMPSWLRACPRLVVFWAQTHKTRSSSMYILKNYLKLNQYFKKSKTCDEWDLFSRIKQTFEETAKTS